MTEIIRAADGLCDANDNRAGEEKDDRFELEQQRALLEDATRSMSLSRKAASRRCA